MVLARQALETGQSAEFAAFHFAGSMGKREREIKRLLATTVAAHSEAVVAEDALSGDDFRVKHAIIYRDFCYFRLSKDICKQILLAL